MTKSIEIKRGYQALADVLSTSAEDIGAALAEVQSALRQAGYVLSPYYAQHGGSPAYHGPEVWYHVANQLKAEIVGRKVDRRPTLGVELFREPDAAVLAGVEPWNPERLVGCLRPDLREAARAVR